MPRRSLYLQFLIFQRSFREIFNVFKDQNSENVQQHLNSVSKRLFERTNRLYLDTKTVEKAKYFQ